MSSAYKACNRIYLKKGVICTVLELERRLYGIRKRLFCLLTGNFTKSNRDYGQPGKRYVALGGSLIYWAIFEAVKLTCQSKTTDEKIKKAIRDGVNTLRLHDKDRRMRQSRRSLAECSNDDGENQWKRECRGWATGHGNMRMMLWNQTCHKRIVSCC